MNGLFWNLLSYLFLSISASICTSFAHLFLCGPLLLVPFGCLEKNCLAGERVPNLTTLPVHVEGIEGKARGCRTGGLLSMLGGHYLAITESKLMQLVNSIAYRRLLSRMSFCGGLEKHQQYVK